MLQQTDFFQDIAKILDFAICVYVFKIIGKFSALFITMLIILVFEVLLYKQSLNILKNVKVHISKFFNKRTDDRIWSDRIENKE